VKPISKQMPRIVLEEVEPHESGHCSWRCIPDYELMDQTGKHRKLSELQGPDPMILVLSRGGYCPTDRRQAEGLVQPHHEMEVGNSRLVTVSTDKMLLTNEYRTGVGAHWTFLSEIQNPLGHCRFQVAPLLTWGVKRSTLQARIPEAGNRLR
jgi:hypothetical protein